MPRKAAARLKRVLVTGASGMLGAALVSRWSSRFNVLATGRSDFAGNPAREFLKFDFKTDSCHDLAGWARPEVIVHCAAMTNVDACELAPDEARLINGESVASLMAAAPLARVILISTDAVMPRDTHLADETARPAPQNVYGESKRHGERIMMAAAGDHCIVRTTIVGCNLNQAHVSFAEWIVHSLRADRPVSLFEDVVFTPITIWRLADELGWLIEHRAPRLLHISGVGPISKYDFGVSLCHALGLHPDLISRSRLAEGRFTATRSRDQTLSSRLFESVSGHLLPFVPDTVGELALMFGGVDCVGGTQ